MPNRATVRNVKAKELQPRTSAAAPSCVRRGDQRDGYEGEREEGRARRDPWAEVRGTLSPDEADEMLRAIHETPRNKSEAPELESP